MPIKDTEENDPFLDILDQAVSVIVEEIATLAQFEHSVSYEFATLEQNDANFSERMNRVIEHLGGPPEYFLVRDGQKPPPADNYPEAAMREALAVFNRSRKAVILADLYAHASNRMDGENSSDKWSDPELREIMTGATQSAFWAHAETAYIRIHSFYDRLGQLLDFAFFNIRQFDRMGFSAVMDRIHSNVVPMDANLRRSGSWKALRKFQTSEQEDGLKWLLQRRNLIVHSLHLHPIKDEEVVFASQFNHLDRAHKEKLRPKDRTEETNLLRINLKCAVSQFRNFLEVIEKAPSRKVDTLISNND